MEIKSIILKFRMWEVIGGTEALTDGDRSILRPELWKLMCVSRTARKSAIYDASVAAQTLTEWEIGASGNEIASVSNSQGGENGRGESRSDFERIPGYRDFLGKTRSDLSKK